MKKVIIFLLVALTVKAHAQNAQWLFGLSKDSCKIFADDVISHFKGAYQFLDAYDAEDNGGGSYYVVSYKSDSIKDDMGKPNVYGIMFRHYNIGENKALEIPGTPRYFVERIKGRFLEIFPVWQKYIDANADKLNMSKAGFIKKDIDNPIDAKRYVHCIFNAESEEDNAWYIWITNQ